MIIGRKRHCAVIQLTHQTIADISLDTNQLGPKQGVDRIVNDLAQEDKNDNISNGKRGGRARELVNDASEEERREDIGDACEDVTGAQNGEVDAIGADAYGVVCGQDERSEFAEIGNVFAISREGRGLFEGGEVGEAVQDRNR